MLEVIIERWNNADGSTDYLWSAWRDGQRIQIGGKFETADEAKHQALEFCRSRLGTDPERLREL